MSLKVISREAAAAFFVKRQWLDQPLSLAFTKENLTRFVRDAGGLQLDSINIVDRAHYLTLWSRFGPYDKAALDKMVYQDRALFEYWAHAACLVAPSDLEGWGRAMKDFRSHRTGWSNWLKANSRILNRVEEEIRKRGPLSSSAFARPDAMGKAGGWWDWKPAHHALHYLWLSGRLAVHARRHF
ncbi:MAG: winged helix DNA-binding domain-containing protein [Elusimicrobia bacterium]|nr:winged helix DNA-binding domain-containing protein [Elusimicrobiota bacterium]